MTDVRRALRNDFLREFSAKLDAEIMRPLSIAESEAKRANGLPLQSLGAGRDDPVGGDRIASPAPPSHSRVEQAAGGVAAILALLPVEDREPVFRAVMKGLRAVTPIDEPSCAECGTPLSPHEAARQAQGSKFAGMCDECCYLKLGLL